MISALAAVERGERNLLALKDSKADKGKERMEEKNANGNEDESARIIVESMTANQKIAA